MEIQRDSYLKQLISYRFDGLVKVITGIRRCGKSYLLKKLYKDYLLNHQVKEEQIISIELDLARDIQFRDPLRLSSFVREKLSGTTEEYYLFIDEIQMSDEVPNPYNPEGKKISFYDALNDLRSIPNLDVYVTGSNSKMLSSDILTEFRGRSDEIRVHPLSFLEYYSAVGGDKNEAFDDYAFYGGMPLILSRPNDGAKMNYLKSLFSEVYIKDIVERKKDRKAGHPRADFGSALFFHRFSYESGKAGQHLAIQARHFRLLKHHSSVYRTLGRCLSLLGKQTL